MNLLDRMFGHDRWTTQRVLMLCEGLSDGQLDQEFDIGQRTLRITFDHMFLAMELWTGLMTGRPIPRQHRRQTVDEMCARHQASYDRFEATARDLVESGRLDETFIDHHQYPQSYGATILQVVMHNQQHRIEALHMLQRLGVPGLPDGDLQEWEHMTGRIAGPWTI